MEPTKWHQQSGTNFRAENQKGVAPTKWNQQIGTPTLFDGTDGLVGPDRVPPSSPDAIFRERQEGVAAADSSLCSAEASVPKGCETGSGGCASTGASNDFLSRPHWYTQCSAEVCVSVTNSAGPLRGE